MGPEVISPGASHTLRSYLAAKTTTAGQFKSAIGSRIQAAKEATAFFLRRQILQALDSMIPHFEGNLRTMRNTLNTSSYYADTIMSALAIPQEASVAELDANIASLRQEIANLKEEFPQLKTTGKVYIPGPSIENTFLRLPRIRQQKEKRRICRTTRKTRRRKKRDKKPLLRKLKCNAEKKIALQNDLKLLLNTGNLNVELFTEDQKIRSGLGPDFFNALFMELEFKNKKKAKKKKNKFQKTIEVKNLKEAHQNLKTPAVEEVD